MLYVAHSRRDDRYRVKVADLETALVRDKIVIPKAERSICNAGSRRSRGVAVPHGTEGRTRWEAQMARFLLYFMAEGSVRGRGSKGGRDGHRN